jgi:NitT/TauT family transport system substrate-binding protein
MACWAATGFWFDTNRAIASKWSHQKLSIAAMPFSFTGYAIFIALERGDFKAVGLDVKIKLNYTNGMETMKAILHGEADIALSSETPFINTILNGGQIEAIATTITARGHLGVVARKDRGIQMPMDLKGKNIGVTMGSNGEYFLDLVLLLNSIPETAVHRVDIKPQDMADTLLAGDVDAVATWNPQKHMVYKKLGDRGVLFTAKGIYKPFFIAAATKAFIHRHPQVIEKFIRALYNASQFIIANPRSSRAIVSRYLKIDSRVLEELGATYLFNVTLEQSLVLEFENQTHWSIRSKKTVPKRMPNYLDFIYIDALKKVAPQNMTIIK